MSGFQNGRYHFERPLFSFHLLLKSEKLRTGSQQTASWAHDSSPEEISNEGSDSRNNRVRGPSSNTSQDAPENARLFRLRVLQNIRQTVLLSWEEAVRFWNAHMFNSLN